MLIKPLLDALGSMDVELLAHIHDTLPVEFSVIDAEEKVLYWNKHGERLFPRGPGVIGRSVQMCHPKESLDKVNEVISLLKSGERDYIDFWIDMPENGNPRKILIRYYAIRDADGNYLGTLEASMNITPFKSIEGENRLGDM